MQTVGGTVDGPKASNTKVGSNRYICVYKYV